MESRTWVREQRIAVGNIPVRIANHAPDRHSLLISNTGNAAVTIGTRADIDAGNGIVLLPDGTASFTEIEDFALTRYEWYAVANSGASSVDVWQTVERQVSKA